MMTAELGMDRMDPHCYQAATGVVTAEVVTQALASCRVVGRLAASALVVAQMMPPQLWWVGGLAVTRWVAALGAARPTPGVASLLVALV